MKRNNLTTAVVAGLTGVAGLVNLAGAVDLNPDGLGQVLIYPYYTVNGGNQTLVSVVNTTAVAKAVKVRFLEGHNSREVLDFNLFLSPFDVWTAAVFSLATGTGAPGNLVTTDTSCTAPAIRTNTGLPTLPDGRHYVPFRNIAYSGTVNDTGPETLDRTREGHLEMIEMATLTDATATAVTHVGGTPPGCASVQALAPTSTTLLSPTGGLFGSGSIVNTAQGVMNAYNADAIDGFFTVAGNLFSATSSLTPSLAQADNSNVVALSAVSYVFNNGTLIQSNYLAPNHIDAVSAVFAANAIYNEYELEAAAGAESEWIITFPTKRFYVDDAIVGAGPAAIAPFHEVFGAVNDDESCVLIGLNIYNREEATTTTSVDFSPPPATPQNSLCYEAQVLTFQRAADYTSGGGVSRILGSTLTTNVDARGLGFEAGWLRLDLNPGGEPHAMRASTDLDVFNGLPVTGYLATQITNNNVTPGVLANYSALYRHRASRSCTNTGGACS